VTRHYTVPIVEVVKIIDGDSLRVVVDLGWHISKQVDVRLSGINTPEVRGREAAAGKLVKGYVEQWIAEAGPIELISLGLDKYGRSLGLVDKRGPKDNWSLNVILSLNGYAKDYGGGKREPFTGEELAAIIAKLEGGAT